ncbi:LCP family protein [Lactovum miscens]|uniref:Regulatory protein MsrR n=1 Tax=Lactovum miscens TaxID=190387 RepID=A0A841C4L9_9LACT|nr:LCP family protein [Lactovum miscens]MBB5887763.1 LCP family protein required for cell wall assembly [Lactovum miscens]
MEKQLLNRLRYLRQNYDYLSPRELKELANLEARFAAEENFRTPSTSQQRFNDGLDEDEYQPGQFLKPDYQNYYRGDEEDWEGIDDSPYIDNGFEDYEDSEHNENQDEQSTQNNTRLSRQSSKKAGSSRRQTISSKNSKPKQKKKHHWIRNIFLLFLTILLVLIGFFIYGYAQGSKEAGGAVKTETFNGQKTSSGAINILVMGADQRPNQSSQVAHTDSIMIVQFNAKDHKVKMLSIMRDTLVNIPGYSNGSDDDLKINTAFTLGEQEGGKGPELLRETIQANFGIKCQYYALTDFSSFASIIDTLFPSGVPIDAQFGTIGGQTYNEVPVPDDLSATDGIVASDKTLSDEEATAYGYDAGGIFMMIKQGQQKMDGRTLLNYSRFRHDDNNDFGRVQRQQQVMSTLMSNLKNPLSLFTGASALGKAKALTETNIPNSFFLLNGPGAVLDFKNGTSKYSVPDPTLNDWQNAYDQYYGLGLEIDIPTYSQRIENFFGN